MSIKHTIRTEDGTETVNLTPLTAVKRLCIECFGFDKQAVKDCTSPLCPVFPFRTGKAHTGRSGNVENLR